MQGEYPPPSEVAYFTQCVAPFLCSDLLQKKKKCEKNKKLQEKKGLVELNPKPLLSSLIYQCFWA